MVMFIGEQLVSGRVEHGSGSDPNSRDFPSKVPSSKGPHGLPQCWKRRIRAGMKVKAFSCPATTLVPQGTVSRNLVVTVHWIFGGPNCLLEKLHWAELFVVCFTLDCSFLFLVWLCCFFVALFGWFSVALPTPSWWAQHGFKKTRNGFHLAKFFRTCVMFTLCQCLSMSQCSVSRLCRLQPILSCWKWINWQEMNREEIVFFIQWCTDSNHTCLYFFVWTCSCVSVRCEINGPHVKKAYLWNEVVVSTSDVRRFEDSCLPWVHCYFVAVYWKNKVVGLFHLLLCSFCCFTALFANDCRSSNSSAFVLKRCILVSCATLHHAEEYVISWYLCHRCFPILFRMRALVTGISNPMTALRRNRPSFLCTVDDLTPEWSSRPWLTRSRRLICYGIWLINSFFFGLAIEIECFCVFSRLWIRPFRVGSADWRGTRTLAAHHFGNALFATLDYISFCLDRMSCIFVCWTASIRRSQRAKKHISPSLASTCWEGFLRLVKYHPHFLVLPRSNLVQIASALQVLGTLYIFQLFRSVGWELLPAEFNFFDMVVFVIIPCLPGSMRHFFLCLPSLQSKVYTQRPSLVFVKHLRCFYMLLLCLPDLRPGYTPKDPRLPTECIIKFAYAIRCNAAPVIASTWLLAFPIGLVLFHKVFLLALPPLIGTGAIALLSLLLHVFVDSFAVHLQKLCDVMAINSRRYSHFDFADWWVLRPGLTQAASSKKKSNRISSIVWILGVFCLILVCVGLLRWLLQFP